MHASSFIGMKLRLNQYVFSELSGGIVIDIGSQDINGTYKELFSKDWKYLGIDFQSGKNVDVVQHTEYGIPLSDNYADLLITGQCIEHVRNPFKLMNESIRCLKRNGIVICVAPHLHRIHRYPIDTFRYNPDGMEAIFNEAGCEKIESVIVGNDCWYVGKKLNR